MPQTLEEQADGLACTLEQFKCHYFYGLSKLFFDVDPTLDVLPPPPGPPPASSGGLEDGMRQCYTTHILKPVSTSTDCDSYLLKRYLYVCISKLCTHDLFGIMIFRE